jgi:Arc/MetJ-type ribon-helix-helix transcriptional regulator
MTATLRCCVGVVLLMAGSGAMAQRHRDPLTQPEIDQIRDTSWEPRERLKLYVEFARARLVRMEQMRADPKTTDRAQQTHDLLDDFQLLYDELNDNIETYVDRSDDIRKPLKLVIEADTEFQAKLRALKDAAAVKPEESRQYEFVLSNLLETLDTSAEDHKKLLADQEEAAKHKKLNTNPSKGTGVGPE